MEHSYICLKNNRFHKGSISLVPIRFKDRYKIMKWRNEQMYHLRQNKILTFEDQDQYFLKTLLPSFNLKYPNQVLFSFLNKANCIGYGGLVHIDWIKKSAEISFLINTSLEQKYFETYWKQYLELIEKVSFKELNLIKIFVYAFDIRPNLYIVLKQNGFHEEKRIKNYTLYKDKLIDVVVHSKNKP